MGSDGMTTAYAEAVDRGVAFLDEHVPGWWRVDAPRPINLIALDMRATTRCVLGQACPLEVLADYRRNGDEAASPYWAYARVLSRIPDGDKVASWAVEHGFSLLHSVLDDGWSALTDEWFTRIADRREQAAAEVTAGSLELAGAR
jgi:hypothetical protein